LTPFPVSYAFLVHQLNMVDIKARDLKFELRPAQFNKKLLPALFTFPSA